MKNDYIRAIGDCTRAIELKPDYADAYCKRSEVYSQQGNHDKAIMDGTTARKLKPDDIDINTCSGTAYHNSGYVLSKKKEYDKALTHLTLAIELYTFAIENGKLGDAYLTADPADAYLRGIMDHDDYIEHKIDKAQRVKKIEIEILEGLLEPVLKVI